MVIEICISVSARSKEMSIYGASTVCQAGALLQELIHAVRWTLKFRSYDYHAASQETKAQKE